MNIDAALAAIDGLDGAGLDLGERETVWPDFPVDEYRRRYAKLSALMDREGLDALVLTQEEPVRYLSGYNSVVWAVGRWLPTRLRRGAGPAPVGPVLLRVRRRLRGRERAGRRSTSVLTSKASWPGWSPATWRRSARPRTGPATSYGPGTFMALPQYVAHPILAAGAGAAAAAGAAGGHATPAG